MHRRREKRREQRNAAVSALLDRIDATPSLAPPVRGWDLSARSDTICTGVKAGSACVDWAALPGLDPASDALLKPDRAQRKRQQLESLLCILREHILQRLYTRCHGKQRPLRFVDFACGSGHFGLLVASQVPNSQITLVDMQEHGLEKARGRAKSLGLSSQVNTCGSLLHTHFLAVDARDETAVGAGCGSIGDYEDEFDCALGLHSCGSLTDLILAQAVSCRAAFCVAPCCYGRLLAPQSDAFRAESSWLGEDAFLLLARAAEHHDNESQLQERPQQQQPEPESEQEGPRQHPRVCVFAEPELQQGLAEQGAEWVGGVDLMDAILAGDVRLPIDVADQVDGADMPETFIVLASPSILPMLGTKLGRLLGPRKLMPHPRVGTVTADLAGALHAAMVSSQTTCRKDLGKTLARRAMHALDCDRALLLAQPERGGGYSSRLARLTPLTCSPKHNVLLGWPAVETASSQSGDKPMIGDAAQWSAGEYMVGADRATSGATVRDRVGKHT